MKRSLLLSIALVLFAGENRELRAASLELWASPTGSGNGLTSGNPTNASTYAKFDYLFTHPGNPVTIHLAAGNYETDGLELSSFDNRSLNIQGAGPGSTVIKIRNDATVPSGTQYLNAFSISNGFFDTFQIRDVNIDCNWFGQSAYYNRVSTTQSFRDGAMWINCRTGIVYNVFVHDFGANDKQYINGGVTNFCHPSTGVDASGTEVFPVHFTTVADANSYNSIRIEACSVWGFHSSHNGYATGIFLNTRWYSGTGANPNATLGSGYASTWAGYVGGCDVSDMTDGAIAFGVGDSDKVLFENNWVLHSVAGFNCDTGANRRIELVDNYFEVIEGIHFGSTSSDTMRIDGNTFGLLEPYTNPCGGYFDSYAIRVDASVTTSSINSNTVYKETGYGNWSGSYKKIATPGTDSLNASLIQSDFKPVNTTYTW